MSVGRVGPTSSRFIAAAGAPNADPAAADEAQKVQEAHDAHIAEVAAAAATAAANAAHAAAELRTYTVVSGDTLSGIGAKYGVSYQSIAALNHVANPDLIHPGQVFKIPHN